MIISFISRCGVGRDPIFFSTQRSMLRKAHMMRIGGCATANQTWLFADEPDMFAIANSARFGMAKFAVLDVRGVSLLSYFARSDIPAFAFRCH